MKSRKSKTKDKKWSATMERLYQASKQETRRELLKYIADMYRKLSMEINRLTYEANGVAPERLKRIAGCQGQLEGMLAVAFAKERMDYEAFIEEWDSQMQRKIMRDASTQGFDLSDENPET